MLLLFGYWLPKEGTDDIGPRLMTGGTFAEGEKQALEAAIARGYEHGGKHGWENLTFWILPSHIFDRRPYLAEIHQTRRRNETENQD